MISECWIWLPQSPDLTRPEARLTASRPSSLQAGPERSQTGPVGHRAWDVALAASPTVHTRHGLASAVGQRSKAIFEPSAENAGWSST